MAENNLQNGKWSKTVTLLRPWNDILKVEGNVSYNEGAKAWNTIRFKRQILEQFPALKDRGNIIRYKLVFYKSYEELANAVEELKAGDAGLPLVLYLYKDDNAPRTLKNLNNF